MTNHYDGGLAGGGPVDDWQDGHRIVTLAQAVALVMVGEGCLRCRWVAAGMVLNRAAESPAEVVARAERIRAEAEPTRHEYGGRP